MSTENKRGVPWIGVDLDGTLAHYDGWNDKTHIGLPIQIMVDRVQRWIFMGYDVRIFTARVSEPDAAVREAIQDWCYKYIGVRLPVTNVKDFDMLELWDDRAVQVTKNTGIPVGESTRGLS
jgi:hypothetical protein